MFKTKGAVNLVSNYADLLWADLKTTHHRIFTIVAPIFGQKMNSIIYLFEQCSICKFTVVLEQQVLDYKG